MYEIWGDNDLKLSFTLQAWLGEINEYAQDDVVIMLLGNKSDVTSDRVIRTEDGEQLARVSLILSNCYPTGISCINF